MTRTAPPGEPDNVFPDAKLKCGDRTFEVHRSVLAARSDAFRAYFRNGISRIGSDVRIRDMEVGVLRALLDFVYTGKPEVVNEDNVADLYEAAERYGVHSLKRVCSERIRGNLTAENCDRHLTFADCHSDPALKIAAVSFAVGNPSVLKTRAWRTFSKEPAKMANRFLQSKKPSFETKRSPSVVPVQ